MRKARGNGSAAALRSLHDEGSVRHAAHHAVADGKMKAFRARAGQKLRNHRAALDNLRVKLFVGVGVDYIDPAAEHRHGWISARLALQRPARRARVDSLRHAGNDLRARLRERERKAFGCLNAVRRRVPRADNGDGETRLRFKRTFIVQHARGVANLRQEFWVMRFSGIGKRNTFLFEFFDIAFDKAGRGGFRKTQSHLLAQRIEQRMFRFKRFPRLRY
ncbi:hypothetical protein SDC9_160982 [bioreactor metagenome]|uniref:Uncharacterized protein n=1 Tax=bioreactor metagenome TaxID=1076179 RepID=A0A645FJY8_9ZZZZ